MPLKGNYTPSEVSRALEIASYIEKHYKEKITIQDLAYEAGLDSKLLQKLFSAVNGVSIHQFQLNYRLAKIMDDLLQFDWSIEAIAKKHGFNSGKYFYRFFKKQTGMTAQEYRLTVLPRVNGEKGHGLKRNLASP